MSSQALEIPVPVRTSVRRFSYVWLITSLTALIHLAVAGRYDIFRNELYFIVCGRQPAFGYVDQPPLVPLLAALSQVFGLHVWLLRLPAVAAAVALVPLCAALTALFTSRRLAIISSALAAAICPAVAALTTTLTTSTFEPLAWTACAYFIARAIARNEPKNMLWAGIVTGVSLEAKYGIVMWLIGACIGLAATPSRRVLAWKETWIGFAMASVLAAPSLIWQAVHGWPFLALIAHHHATGFNFTGTPLIFEIDQIAATNILLAPLWMAGVIAPFLSAQLKNARFLSIAFVVATAVDILSGGKNYYLFAVYPMMFAIGAAAIAKLNRGLAIGWLALATANSILMAPIVLPILSPPNLARFMARTHLRPRPEERAAVGAPLTQVFSDELGWRRLEEQVASVYRSLPPADQKSAAIFAPNYGEASAIDVYGQKDGLPPAISGGNQFYLWGPGHPDGRVLIIVNGSVRRWQPFCDSIDDAATFGVPLAMPYERDRPILVCRGLHFDIARAWPHFQLYE